MGNPEVQVTKRDFYKALYVVTDPGHEEDHFDRTLEHSEAVGGIFGYHHVQPYENVDLTDETQFARRFPKETPSLRKHLLLLEKFFGNGDGRFNAQDKKFRQLDGRICKRHLRLNIGLAVITLGGIERGDNIDTKRVQLHALLRGAEGVFYTYFAPAHEYKTQKLNGLITREEVQKQLDLILPTDQERRTECLSPDR